MNNRETRAALAILFRSFHFIVWKDFYKTNTHLSSQLTEHIKRQRHMALEIQVLSWEMYDKVPVNEITTHLS